MYQDEFLNKLIGEYSIDLNTGNDILKKFILRYNEKLLGSDYCLIPDNIHIIRCFEDNCVPGRKGTCISEKDYCYILLYTGFFQDVINHCPKYRQDVIKSYVMALLHEIAHFLVDRKFNFDDSIDAHGQDWLNCARFLGVEEKYLYPYI